MFIKKIFENKVDESVHRHFVRFGKGNYGMRAVMNINKQKDKIKISSSFEYALDFVEFIASVSESVKISGIILSRQEISGLEGKKKIGLFNYELDKEIKSNELKNFLDKCYFALLDCNSSGIELKVKKKLPKPGKGNEAKVNDKFCVMTLEPRFWQKIHSDFLFDLPSDFKRARLEHTYIFNEIVIPAELKKEKDFEKMRLEAKRKGQMIRKSIVDGRERETKKEMSV